MAFKSAISPVDAGNQPLLDTHADDSRCLCWQRRKLELRGNQLVFIKERNRLIIFLRRLLRLGRGTKAQNFISLTTRHIAVSFPANKLAVFEDQFLQEALRVAAVRQSNADPPPAPSPSVIKPSRLQMEVDHWLKARYDASDPMNRCWVVFATLTERNEWESSINDHVVGMRSDKCYSRVSTEEDDTSTVGDDLKDDPLMNFYAETKKAEKASYELRRAETKHYKIGRRFRFRPRSSSCYVAKPSTKRDRLEEYFTFVREFVESKESASPSCLPSHFTFN